MHRFHTADVFTDRAFGGNPLAVFPDASGIDPALFQPIAREFNLSETVFVLPPESPESTCRLRIFTPAGELPFAGHPTVGTALVLARTGAVALDGDETRLVLEEGVGPVPVTVRARGGMPEFAQLSAALMPRFGPPPPPRDALAGVLSLDADDLLDGDLAPEVVSCGVPFVFVTLRDLDALARLRLDVERWRRTLADLDASKIYPVVLTGGAGGCDVRARMFAPAEGFGEDPATGGAATALAGYLLRALGAPDGVVRWTVGQGYEMGRPSTIEVEADVRDGAATAIRVGGAAVMVSEGTMSLPPP